MTVCKFCESEFDPGLTWSGKKSKRSTCNYKCESALTERTVKESFAVYSLWEGDTSKYAKMNGVAPWAWTKLARAEVRNPNPEAWEASRVERQALLFGLK